MSKAQSSMVEVISSYIAESEEKVEALKVLRDEAGHKLGNKIWKDLVSENDFSKFPSFMQEFDELLFKYRGEKPVTDKEIEEIGEDLEKEGKEKDEDEEESEDTAGVESESNLIVEALSSALAADTKKRGSDIDGRKALKLDKDFYVDKDETGTWGVYGTETGFCYGTPHSKVEADKLAKDLKQTKDTMNLRHKAR